MLQRFRHLKTEDVLAERGIYVYIPLGHKQYEERQYSRRRETDHNLVYR
jgi:hypothetical protein